MFVCVHGKVHAGKAWRQRQEAYQRFAGDGKEFCLPVRHEYHQSILSKVGNTIL